MKAIRILTALIVLPVVICCKSNGQEKKPEANSIKHVVQSAPKPESRRLGDEQEFRKLLENIKGNLKNRKLQNVLPALNFPFYTSHQAAAESVGLPIDPITSSEFNTYKSAIFNPDVLRVLPLCNENNLSEIDDKTDEVYYQTLKKLTDSGSKMYEVYMQYPEKGTQAESFFSFVFGKVNGRFKMLATYSKWPVK